MFADIFQYSVVYGDCVRRKNALISFKKNKLIATNYKTLLLTTTFLNVDQET